MANATNPWARWGLVYTTRDGFPVLTEGALWQLSGSHPEAVERVSADEVYVHLDQPYRAVLPPDRAFRLLVPAPERRRRDASE